MLHEKKIRKENMTTKETKNIWMIIGIIVVGLIILFAVIAPFMQEKSEQDRLELEMSKCEYSAAGDIYGPNGKCVLKFGEDGQRHIYWERER